MIYIYLVLIKLCHHKDRVAVVRNAYHKITFSSRALFVSSILITLKQYARYHGKNNERSLLSSREAQASMKFIIR